jgi:hypothetical protein
MSEGAKIRDIDALGELKAAFGRFSEDVSQILPAIQKELEQIQERLEERHAYWQQRVDEADERVNAAHRDLASCKSSGYYDDDGDYMAPDCRFEQDEVWAAKDHQAECRNNLETVKQWTHRIECQIADFRNDLHRLAHLASERTGAAQAFLAGKDVILRKYVGGDSGRLGKCGFQGQEGLVKPVPIESPNPVGPNSSDKELYYCARIRNQHLAGRRHPRTGIPFNEYGFPRFESVAIKTVRIKFSGNRPVDRRMANKEAGLDSTPKGFIWHHNEDCDTMQLIPKDVHKRTGHSGGFAGIDALYTFQFPDVKRNH